MEIFRTDEFCRVGRFYDQWNVLIYLKVLNTRYFGLCLALRGSSCRVFSILLLLLYLQRLFIHTLSWLKKSLEYSYTFNSLQDISKKLNISSIKHIFRSSKNLCTKHQPVYMAAASRGYTPASFRTIFQLLRRAAPETSVETMAMGKSACWKISRIQKTVCGALQAMVPKIKFSGLFFLLQHVR